MKLTVLMKTASLWDRSAARLESKLRKGFVQVVSIQCGDCGRWMDPANWDPASAACDTCTTHLRQEGFAGRFGDGRFSRQAVTS
ncbi:hypothetical protein Rhe02_83830 [Rhizocola hellebori]|uniref:Uncharacterized protein n=1 Tax=Rhizocola hellebori TaxID=1392758 RepID=A0A8J3VLQ0_9ACTN|nr:hypothetical protein [Rhizocola hellebori]GIH10316.1 hypothetical protein Rhe02_83830 [Rhizocola hellebori]